MLAGKWSARSLFKAVVRRPLLHADERVVSRTVSNSRRSPEDRGKFRPDRPSRPIRRFQACSICAAKRRFRETAACSPRSELFLGLVGFPMHLARAVDRPAVIVYGQGAAFTIRIFAQHQSHRPHGILPVLAMERLPLRALLHGPDQCGPGLRRHSGPHGSGKTLAGQRHRHALINAHPDLLVKTLASSISAYGSDALAAWRALPRPERVRLRNFAIWIAVVTVAFAQPLFRLMVHASEQSLHSHIARAVRRRLHVVHQRVRAAGCRPWLGGGSGSGVRRRSWRPRGAHRPGWIDNRQRRPDLDDTRLPAMAVAGGFLFVGARWMATAFLSPSCSSWCRRLTRQ